MDRDPADWAAEMAALATHWRAQIPERRQGRSQRRQADILQAALRVFSRDGIARARIADIAAEAGMPLSSLYEYYGSKEAIAYAVPVAQLASFFVDYAERVRDARTVRDRLRTFLWLSADFARRNPEWARTLYLEIWPSVLVGDSPTRQSLDDYGRLVVRLLHDGAAAGEWAAEPDAYQTAAILIGSQNQVVITWLLYRKPRDVMRAINSLLDRLLAALLPPPAHAGLSRAGASDKAKRKSGSGRSRIALER